MGVHRLFYYMTQHHGSCMVPAVMSRAYPSSSSSSGGTDVLLIDVNAFVYPVVQRVVEGDPRGAATPWSVIVDAIIQGIRETAEWVGPRHGLYLAIDGVAGSAKQAQQRKRRFKGSGSESESVLADRDASLLLFDTTAISAGSPFLQYFQARLKKEAPTLVPRATGTPFHVWISDDAIAGEGEHKLVRFVDAYARTAPAAYHYTVMSIDADVLLLMLGLMLPHSAVLKRDLFSRDPGAYRLVDIAQWSDLIFEEWKSPAYVATRGQTLRDFVAASCLLGNDFIPGVEAAHLGFDGWDHLNLAYLEAVSGHGPLVHALPPAESKEEGETEDSDSDSDSEPRPKRARVTMTAAPEYALHRPTARALAAALAEIEHTALAHRAHSVRTRSRPDSLLRAHTTAAPDAGGTMVPLLDAPAYRRAYYARNFGLSPAPDGGEGLDLEGELVAVAEAYFRGIEYTLVYYLTGIPDWTWSYPHHYAPLCADLARIDPGAENVRWRRDSRPAHVHLALLSILPRTSLKWVPFDCTGLAGALPAWFDPSGLRTDLEGKINDYEAVTILPGVDMVDQRRQILQYWSEHVRTGDPDAPADRDDGRIFAHWTALAPSASQRELLRLCAEEELVPSEGAKQHGTMFHLTVRPEDVRN